MRMFQVLALAVGLPLMLAGAALAIVGLITVPTAMPFVWIGIVVAAAGIAGFAALLLADRNEGRAVFRARLATLHPSRIDWYNRAGLAYDRIQGCLVVATAEQTELVPFADVTSYRYVEPRSGSYGTGVMAVVAVAQSASAASYNKTAGLFLNAGGASWQVRDMPGADGREWLRILGEFAPQAAPR